MATAKKKRPTRGATRSPEKKGMPASVMLGTGFIAGVLSTVLVFNMMNERSPNAPEQNTRAEKVEPAPPAEKPEKCHLWPQIIGKQNMFF